VFDKENDFVTKHRYGKTAATIRTMCVLVGMLSLIRQVVHTKFNRSDVSLHGLDAQALIWKLCAAEVQSSRCGSIQDIISSEFGKPIVQLSALTPSATVRTPPRKLKSDANLDSCSL
jgi:hypothetical protein